MLLQTRYLGALAALALSGMLGALSCSSKELVEYGATAGAAGGTGAAGTTGAGGSSACSVGSEGCACRSDSSCDGTLSCFSKLCVNASGGVGGSAGNSGGVLGGASGVSGADTVCPAPCTPAACTPTVPSSPLLTDFTNIQNDIFSEVVDGGARVPMWWTKFWGGVFVYPNVPSVCADAAVPEYPLSEDTSAGNWHISGTVGNYSGFGIYLEPCMSDLSGYSGISFTIGGNVGATGTLRFTVDSSDDRPPNTCWPNVGTCDPDAGACRSASTTFSVPATPGPVSVLWSALGGGTPVSTLNATQVTGFGWAFDCASCLTAPYPVDLTIDDIELFP